MSEHSLARLEADAAHDAPRPAAGVVATLAAVAATLLGTTVIADSSTALQIAGAVVTSALTLAVVVLAAQSRTSLTAIAAALFSAGAAAIHYAVIADHLEEWWVFGLFFAATGVAQLLWAALVVASPSRRLIWLGVFGNAAIVAAWIVTRTAGSPIGPDAGMPEPVGVADSVATVFELGVVVTGLLAGGAGSNRIAARRAVWSLGAAAWALTAAALLDVLGVAPGLIPAAQ
ncbi:MAG: hypothetical protein ACJ74D_13965 [Gaiellaceae bacterium]